MLFLYVAVVIIALYGVSRILMPEMTKPRSPGLSNPNGLEKKAELMETLLAEKNKNIKLLESENKVLDVQVRSFSKVKTVLEEEILRLKEQNRIFRSELGLPAIQNNENLTI
jgi:hypothetical protein